MLTESSRFLDSSPQQLSRVGCGYPWTHRFWDRCLSPTASPQPPPPDLLIITTDHSVQKKHVSFEIGSQPLYHFVLLSLIRAIAANIYKFPSPAFSTCSHASPYSKASSHSSIPETMIIPISLPTPIPIGRPSILIIISMYSRQHPLYLSYLVGFLCYQLQIKEEEWIYQVCMPRMNIRIII